MRRLARKSFASSANERSNLSPVQRNAYSASGRKPRSRLTASVPTAPTLLFRGGMSSLRILRRLDQPMLLRMHHQARQAPRVRLQRNSADRPPDAPPRPLRRDHKSSTTAASPTNRFWIFDCTGNHGDRSSPLRRRHNHSNRKENHNS